MRTMRSRAERDSRVWFGAGGIFARVWRFVLGMLLCVLAGPLAAAQPDAKNILVLYSLSDRGDFSALHDLQSGLRAVISRPLNFYSENLEGRRFDDQDYERNVAESLRDTYRSAKLDLVIVEKEPALQFALKHRDELFPGVPIVFFDVEAEVMEQKRWPAVAGVTGVTAPADVRGTVDLALRNHPDTDTAAVIIGNSPYERFWLARIHEQLLRHRSTVQEVDLIALAPSQLFERIAELPPQTVVFFEITRQESLQPAIGAYDLLAWVGQRVPTYCVFAWYCLNHGGIGGDSYDSHRQISLVAQQARRILSGEKPDRIPVVHDSVHRILVDWRELRRWNIPESALPPGSAVLYRQPTFWEREQKYILAAIALFAAQSLLIAGLLWQRARRRRTEAVLRESETRFRVMADTTPSLVWMCDAKGKITYLNEQRLAFTGPDSHAGYGDTWIAYIHPDDVKNLLDTLWRALKDQRAFSKEYRLHRNDGVYRWMFDVASPRVNGDGSFAGFIGSAIDITDQKLAQQSLEQVSGQLIEAQEQERTRIARDLHDDICQRLALLSMELEQAHRVPHGSVTATKRSLGEIRKHCSEIATDVQSLSHQLHSSKLDYLGIVAATRGFCREFSKQHGVIVEFKETNVPTHLSKDVSLCLFRVTQEALHNAVKYSGMGKFAVELNATAGEVQLLVADSGAGFDVEAAKKNRGLGLVSMQERVHLVRGTFSVESKPGAGAKILAVVPLIVEDEQSADNGEVKDAVSMPEVA